MKSGKLNFLESSGPLQACNGTALTLPVSYYTASHPRKNHNLSVFAVSCYSNCINFFVISPSFLFLPSIFLCLIAFLISSCPSYQFIFFVYRPSPYWHFILLTPPFHPTIFMSLFLTSIQCETRLDLSRLPPAFQIRPPLPNNWWIPSVGHFLSIFLAWLVTCRPSPYYETFRPGFYSNAMSSWCVCIQRRDITRMVRILN